MSHRRCDDLKDAGVALVGGRLDYVEGHPAAAVVYQRAKHVINLFAWASAGKPDEVFRAEARQGFNVVTWRHNGITYYAVSDVEADQLAEFARLVAQAWVIAAPPVSSTSIPHDDRGQLTLPPCDGGLSHTCRHPRERPTCFGDHPPSGGPGPTPRFARRSRIDADGRHKAAMTIGGVQVKHLFRLRPLLHSILDFGEGCAGTFFIEVAARSTAHAESGNRRSARHDRHTADCIRDIW